ncbi:MAG: LCP family protein [Clostridiales bacterium]|nr:LCP family protein [Clostridiales bacterium]
MSKDDKNISADKQTREYIDVYSDSSKKGSRPVEQYEDVYSNAVSPNKKAPKKKKKHIFLKIAACFMVLVIMAGSAAAFYAYSLLDKIQVDSAQQHENMFLDGKTLKKQKGIINILLIGVDARPGEEASRSDTMMLFTIDTLHSKIKLTSFMRDTYLDIPGKKASRLNSACSWGGPGLVMDTIECNFGIDIDNYALVNFEMFTELVDFLGGVEVEVTEKEAEYMRGPMANCPDVVAGESVLLDGNEALWYCRIRKLDSDFNRTSRQRKVVDCIIEKAKTKSISELADMLPSLLDKIETDLTKPQLTQLAVGAALKYLKYEIVQSSVPADDTWKYANKNGASVLAIDLEKNAKLLEEFIYE